MTPGEIIVIALNRAGNSNPTTGDKDRARDYLNVAKTDLEAVAEWRWLFKTATITTVATQRPYNLTAGIVYIISAWDTTNNATLRIVHPDDVAELDPDEDYTGAGGVLAITGIDTTTGVWEADVYPTPVVSADAIKYRYYATQDDFVEAGDGTEIITYPKQIHNLLLWATCALMKEDGGGEGRDSSTDWTKYGNSMAAALRANGRMNVPATLVMGRRDAMRGFSIVASFQTD